MWIKLLQAWGDHEAGTVLSISEVEAQVLITAGTAEKAEAPSEVTQATQAITLAVAQAISQSVPALVAAEVARVVGQTSTETPGTNVSNAHLRLEDDPTGGFRFFSEFAVAVFQADRPGRHPIDSRLEVLQQAATGQQEGDDALGGYLVPPEHRTALLQLAIPKAELAGRATQIPMQSNSIDMPATIDTDRRAGYRQGGIQVYWVEEAEKKTASTTKFRKIGLKLSELAGLVYVTNVLLEDSPISMEPLLTKMFANEFQFVLDDAVIRGTGGGMPLGILNSPCLTTQAAETGQAAATIVSENVINMYSRMWGPSLGNSVWFANSEILPQLMTMSIAVGTGGVPLWIPGNSLVGAPHGSLIGRPLVFIEQGSALGTVGDLMFMDMSHYMVGQKARGIEFATSIHLRFDYDETAFRYVLRIDGQPWLDNEITPAYGTLTKSPFVALATRS